MVPREIRSLLILKGVEMNEIARRAGVSRQLVGAVVHGRRTNSAIRRAVANAIGVPYLAVWGEPEPTDATGTTQTKTTTGVENDGNRP